jgi:Ca2+/H+ antiporter
MGPPVDPVLSTLSWPEVLVGIGVAAIVLSTMEVEKAMRRLSRAGQPAMHRAGAPFIAAKDSKISSG